MEFFSFLRRRPKQVKVHPPQPPTPIQLTTPTTAPPASEPVAPEQVRRLLFDAVAAGKHDRLDALCHEHRELILRHGPEWLEVPPEVRSNPQIAGWYQQGLKAIVRYCSEKLNHRQLAEQADDRRVSPADAEPEPSSAGIPGSGP